MKYTNKSILIIGAGLGGLSTALRLASRGYKVTILEKHHQAGGRLNQIEKDGFTFDIGPSFFSMSYEFDELFKDCKIENPLTYQELDPLYTVNFKGSDRKFNVYKDLEKLAKEFEGLEDNFVEKVEKYLLNAGQIFHDTEHIVVKNNFDNKLDYIMQLARVPWKHAPKMFTSMWKDLEKHFTSEETKVIFSLVAFFLGATPFETPAVYKLLNYTELKHDGYWNIKGGMYKITEALVQALSKYDVDIYYNTEIESIQTVNNKILGFTDKEGKLWESDLYIVNGDAASFRGKILNRPAFTEKKLDKLDWTLSPFTMYLGVKGKIDGLNHHNYFLGENFRSYADKIFKMSVNPDQPYYYVNVNSKSNPECAPEGCENIFILCPVPDLRYKPDWSDAEELSNTIIKDLSERTGFNIAENLITKEVYTPIDWMHKFNLYKGSGLGLAHGLNQIGGFRPKNKDEKFNNLYYVGASTTPGTGLPIVVISSKLVTERITKEHAYEPQVI
ncbi:MAG: phytoene desaturase [Chitinophagaceae bacterium]|nr:MAG: phytoene desaturase [Chitinophagaceae bacterium]